MADSIYFHDTRQPFIIADVPAVTLATTAKALYTASFSPVFGGQYWTLGKRIRIRLFGRITTVLTPGNGQFTLFYGNGADNTGVSLVTSAAFALTASQTNLAWTAEFYVHVRSTGSTGTLFADGTALFNNAVVASTLQPLMIPASAPVVSGACDLTAANILSVQFSRSGSTAETMQVHDIQIDALN